MKHEYLVAPTRHWLGFRSWIIAGLGFLTATLLMCGWQARLPNETLEFSRITRSKLDIAEISSKLENVSKWKEWIHSAAEVVVVNSENQVTPPSEQKARTGALIEIHVDPGKGKRKRFTLVGRITRFEPGKLLEIQILDDSSGKIFKLFDQLSWKIEIAAEAQGKGTQITGTELTHTAHWRSRLFARTAKRVMLNQLFYPNLLVLADPDSAIKSEEKIAF